MPQLIGRLAKVNVSGEYFHHSELQPSLTTFSPRALVAVGFAATR
jgi:hypothetical protein